VNIYSGQRQGRRNTVRKRGGGGPGKGLPTRKEQKLRSEYVGKIFQGLGGGGGGGRRMKSPFPVQKKGKVAEDGKGGRRGHPLKKSSSTSHSGLKERKPKKKYGGINGRTRVHL